MPYKGGTPPQPLTLILKKLRGAAMRRILTLPATAAVLALSAAVVAQTSPTPGPNRPEQAPSPLSNPGADMMINPTDEQCRAGWNEQLKWTREQFESYCAQMKSAK